MGDGLLGDGELQVRLHEIQVELGRQGLGVLGTGIRGVPRGGQALARRVLAQHGPGQVQAQGQAGAQEGVLLGHG